MVYLNISLLENDWLGVKNSKINATINRFELKFTWGFPGGTVAKNLPVNAGYVGSIPGSGRSPGGENGNLLWYSCLGNPMDRGTWQTTVCGVTKESDMT